MEFLHWTIKKLCQAVMDKTYSPNHLLADKYKVEKVLGDGNYGIVYLCKELKSNRKCVVKQMRKSKKKENEQLYIQETNVLRFLNHPSIPKLIETFTYEKTKFFSMQFIEGDNLDDLLFSKEKRFTEIEALLSFKGLLEIISYIHEKGIAHGDIRIPNVMIGDDKLYLIDFGLTQYLQSGMEKNTVQDDYYDLGDFLLFLLYSTFDTKSKKNQPWTEELNLHTGTTNILKKLLQIDKPYDNITDIIKDTHQIIEDLSN
ncbi:protein kinase family protein [Gracilibacillus xinjiangensis]|uniref:Protein kinase family protein n=1 Tax=Gracilibacillus xinjiangensis TaxID=1193282 RepID=A0ABV8WUE6_9BACI